MPGPKARLDQRAPASAKSHHPRTRHHARSTTLRWVLQVCKRLAVRHTSVFSAACGWASRRGPPYIWGSRLSVILSVLVAVTATAGSGGCGTWPPVRKRERVSMSRTSLERSSQKRSTS